MPWVSVEVRCRMAVFTAASTSHQNLTMFGLDARQAVTSGWSSSSASPMSRAPIAVSAPTEPPYPKASSAILPFCRRCEFCPCFSTGTWNMALADAQ